MDAAVALWVLLPLAGIHLLAWLRAGTHQVQWIYRPPGLAAGGVLTLVGLAGCEALARRRWRRA